MNRIVLIALAAAVLAMPVVATAVAPPAPGNTPADIRGGIRPTPTTFPTTPITTPSPTSTTSEPPKPTWNGPILVTRRA